MSDMHTNELDTAPISIPAPSGQVVYSSGGDEVDVGQEFSSFDVSAAQEETRAKIALYFTKFFLALVAISVAVPFIINLLVPGTFADPLGSSKELVTLLASVLAGPFGFIVGFYFKQGNG